MTSSTLGSTMSRLRSCSSTISCRATAKRASCVGRPARQAGVGRRIGVGEIVKHVRPREHHCAADDDGQQGKCRCDRHPPARRRFPTTMFAPPRTTGISHRGTAVTEPVVKETSAYSPDARRQPTPSPSAPVINSPGGRLRPAAEATSRYAGPDRKFSQRPLDILRHTP